MLFIRDIILLGVSVVKNQFDTLIMLKLDKCFFNFQSDIYLCCLYLWPDDSPAARIFDVDLFDVFAEDILYYEQLGSVVLAADWNAQVGNRNYYIVCDTPVVDIDNYECRPDNPLGRASEDSVCNPRGTKVLDLCKALSLRIANSRLDHDFNVGELTYYSQHSHSITEYLVLKECDFSTIHKFCVGEFNSYSDHAPLHFTIYSRSIVNPNDSDDRSQNMFYRGDNDTKGMFRRGLLGKLPAFNTIVNDVNDDENISFNNMVNQFSETLCSVANPLFEHAFTNNMSKTKCSKIGLTLIVSKHIVYINRL